MLRQNHMAGTLAQNQRANALRRVMARLQNSELEMRVWFCKRNWAVAKLKMSQQAKALWAMRQLIAKWRRSEALAAVWAFRQNCEAGEIAHGRRRQALRRAIARAQSSELLRVLHSFRECWSVGSTSRQHYVLLGDTVDDMKRWQRSRALRRVRARLWSNATLHCFLNFRANSVGAMLKHQRQAKALTAMRHVLNRWSNHLLQQVLRRFHKHCLVDRMGEDEESKLVHMKHSMQRWQQSRALNRVLARGSTSELLRAVSSFREHCVDAERARQRRAGAIRRVLARWQSSEMQSVFVAMVRSFQSDKSARKAMRRVLARWQCAELQEALWCFKARSDEGRATQRRQAMALRRVIMRGAGSRIQYTFVRFRENWVVGWLEGQKQALLGDMVGSMNHWQQARALRRVRARRLSSQMQQCVWTLRENSLAAKMAIANERKLKVICQLAVSNRMALRRILSRVQSTVLERAWVSFQHNYALAKHDKRGHGKAIVVMRRVMVRWKYGDLVQVWGALRHNFFEASRSEEQVMGTIEQHRKAGQLASRHQTKVMKDVMEKWNSVALAGLVFGRV
eukprot:TRINITY_DN5723_c0_g4_i1.p1 TRINITY_DN5723_c0_g4~~TRINITY_DN5723_c0_g4_i1.p1  ORF type:complete len:566 (+),score=117.36 TRINITY_DN5723_c0_g4_i1:274-1971(+)